MLTTSSLAPLQRVLLGADGTVTHILEAYADEPIEAVKLEQTQGTAGEDAEVVDATPGTPVLHRRVVLRGRRTGRTLLYAEAIVVNDRVGITFVEGLVGTDLPIGTLLAASRTETFREILAVGREPAGRCAAHFGISPTDDVLFRTYRILSRKKPILLITERFPATWFLGRPV